MKFARLSSWAVIVALSLVLVGCSTTVGPPPPSTIHLAGANDFIDSSPFQGRSDAPVTILVFADFSCAHCRKAAENLETIQEEFPNKVRVVFKHSPNSPRSIPLAKAAIAAGLQGRFWEMHDLLYEEMFSGAENRIERAAERLQLDLARFARERRSREVARLLLADLRLGNRWGIQATPTFVVEGDLYVGALTLPQLRAIVHHSLATKFGGTSLRSPAKKRGE